MSQLLRRRFVVRGRVQGVNFRWFVVEAARSLGLRGWVRNREDGAVEMVAEGAPEALDVLRERCRLGPRFAEVSDVEESVLEGERRYADFQIRHDAPE